MKVLIQFIQKFLPGADLLSLIMQTHLSEVPQSLLPPSRQSKKGKYHKLKAFITTEKSAAAAAASSAPVTKHITKNKSMTKSPPRRSLSSGPIDLDEDIENEKIMLVEIEQLLRDKELRRLSQQTRNNGSCSSVGSCSFTSSTASFSDDSSSTIKETSRRRVVFSDQVQCIQAVKWDKSVDRRNLWWTGRDREKALNAMRSEARILASSPKYRGACTTILLHCKALSEANEEECLEEDHGVVSGTRSQRLLLTAQTPNHVAEAVRYLTDAQVRGLERACLQRLRLRTPGRPCYYWRCSPVRATANVLQLQDRLSNILDLSHQEKGCLISVQYQPYGFYASTWAQLLAEGDAAEIQREYRRMSL